MSSNATPTTASAPTNAITAAQPPLPPAQTFDIVPPLHALLSRLEPSLNVYTPDTSAHLPPNASHPAQTSASALPTSTAPVQHLEYKDAAVAAQFLRSRIRKAMTELGGLADMHRGVDEQEEEIRKLEARIEGQKAVLKKLGVMVDDKGREVKKEGA